MACGSCRKPRQIRTPSTTNGNSNIIASSGKSSENSSNSSGDQRSRITGLNYVKK